MRSTAGLQFRTLLFSSIVKTASCAVSATGHGEFFIRLAVAHDICARVAYRGDRLEQESRRGVLEQETGGTDSERLVDVLVEREGGEHEHLGGAEPFVAADRSGRLEPVHARHADVHQHDVRAQPLGQPHRLVPVGRLSDHSDVGRGVEQNPDAGADQALVVDDERTDHGCPLPGRFASTRHPDRDVGAAVSVPPSTATRCRIPSNP